MVSKQFIVAFVKLGGVDKEIWGIYQSPYSKQAPITYATFLDEMRKPVNDILHSKLNVLMMCDFNLHVEIKGDPHTFQFKEMLQALGSRQLVDFPTHRSGSALY